MRLSHIARLLLIVFLFVNAAYSQSQQSPNIHNATEYQKITEKSIRNKSQKQISIEHKAESEIHADCCNCEPEKTWWERLLTDPVAGFTALLFIVTGGLVYIGLRQEQTTRAIQRAFVFVKEPQFFINMKPNGFMHSMDFWVILENSGTTPSQKTITQVGITHVQNIDDFVFGVDPTGRTPPNPQPSVLGPKAVIRAGDGAGACQIGAEIINAVCDKKRHMFLWGKIDYEDIFGKRHCAEFCFKIDIRGNLNIVHGECLVSFNVHGEYNRHYEKSAGLSGFI